MMFHYLFTYHAPQELFLTKFDVLQMMQNAPTPESIRRCRQKIQEGGELLGTKRLARLAEQEPVKEFLGYNHG